MGLARLGDLSKPTAPAYFFWMKLMFIGVMNFGHVPMLRLVSVNVGYNFTEIIFNFS